MELEGDCFDLDDGKLLTVTAAAVVAFTTTHFEDRDLFAALVFENFERDFRAFDGRRADFGFCAFAGENNFVNDDRVARYRLGIAVDCKDIAFGNGELASLRDNCRFHCFAKKY